jgi:hypothetical protein
VIANWQCCVTEESFSQVDVVRMHPLKGYYPYGFLISRLPISAIAATAGLL